MQAGSNASQRFTEMEARLRRVLSPRAAPAGLLERLQRRLVASALAQEISTAGQWRLLLVAVLIVLTGGVAVLGLLRALYFVLRRLAR